MDIASMPNTVTNISSTNNACYCAGNFKGTNNIELKLKKHLCCNYILLQNI